MEQVSGNASKLPRGFCARQIHTGMSGSADAIKVCLYSHDTFGLGHLRRNLAIAEQLLRADGRFAVWLLTGSPVIREWDLPLGLRVQPLPPVVKTGAERYASRTPGQVWGLTKGYREALIMRLVESVRPDVFLVDHAPAGMNGELLSTLALIHNELPQTRTVLGLRDILDEPAIVRDIWREQDIHALIENAYDDVLVYGSERLFDVIAGYELSSAVARRVKYCGYVVGRSRPAGATGSVCWNEKRAAGRPVVLVTAGGGGDGYFLMDAYLQTLERLTGAGIYSVIVTGPLMPADQGALLRAAVASRDDAECVGYTTDLVPSLRAAEIVVAMAGYNTSAELLAARKKAILVPRNGPREEQRLRAKMLARLGLVTYAEPGPELGRDLAAAIPQLLPARASDTRDWSSFDLRGAERVAAHFSTLAAGASKATQGAA